MENIVGNDLIKGEHDMSIEEIGLVDVDGHGQNFAV